MMIAAPFASLRACPRRPAWVCGCRVWPSNGRARLAPADHPVVRAAGEARRRPSSTSTPGAWCSSGSRRCSTIRSSSASSATNPLGMPRSGSNVARLRRHRRPQTGSSSPTTTSSTAPTRSRSCSPTAASSRPRWFRPMSRPTSPCCGSRRHGAKSCRRWRSAIPTIWRSATWCWRSAIRSASGRP